MFGAGTILALSATPALNMGVATERSGAAKCVLYAVAKAKSPEGRTNIWVILSY